MLEKKTPSLIGKIASLLLLFIGALLIYTMIGQFYRYGSIDIPSILAIVFGIGIIWSVTKLWHRWLMALGVIFIWFGGAAFIPLYLSTRPNIQLAPDILRAAIFHGMTFLVMGIILIFLQKRKDKIIL